MGDARARSRRRRAPAGDRAGACLTIGAVLGRLDAGRLHGGAGIRLQAIRTGAERLDAAFGLVSRFRSSHILAAASNANFGIKGTTSNSMILVPLLNPKFANALAA